MRVCSPTSGAKFNLFHTTASGQLWSRFVMTSTETNSVVDHCVRSAGMGRKGVRGWYAATVTFAGGNACVVSAREEEGWS